MDDLMKTLSTRSSNSHRYVIDEDSIPKVTSDGEPHEVMTMVAAFSGMIAAVIILLILIILIDCRGSNRRHQQTQQQQQQVEQQNQQELQSNSRKSNKGVLIPMFHKNKIDGSPCLMSISTISPTSGSYDNPGCTDAIATIATTTTEVDLTTINFPRITTIKC